MNIPYDTQMITANGVHLHTVLAGDPYGTPIVFLHGFPDFWYGWHNQIPFFAQRGYRVIAPDQRGYNLSDKPKNIEDYRISILATDVKALIEALGYERVHLVGHDWGAAVAWWVATMYPERLITLNILNVPYPTVMMKQLQAGDLSQLLKSWYMFFFQIPGLPEALVSVDGYARMGDILKRTSNPGSFSDEDIALYRQAWAQPGAMTASINWYRAMFRSASETRQVAKQNALESGRKIQTPTLILWGEKDAFLGTSLARESLKVVENGELVFFPKSTHWIQHDEPDDVNQYLLEWITRDHSAAPDITASA
jgi:pimeloyl-ACP methyl ester carboxylesterase